MKTSIKIIQYIENVKEASAKQLTDYLEISERAVFKQLAKLITEGKLKKIGKPPKVFYKINEEINDEKILLKANPLEAKQIEENFLYITPLGKYLVGLEGFVKWCEERDLDPNKQVKHYSKVLAEVYKNKTNKVIIATEKFVKSFEENFLTKVFYVDFYSIPQFGKTKLGQLLLYAKQSQDKKRIREITDLAKGSIDYVIKKYGIDAIGYIPPTIKREVQFMKELEKNLNLTLPKITITKIKTEIIVPQKTLSKIKDRIANAKNTIMIEEKGVFKNVLLIDDATGSGATLNETAKKIINNKIAKNIFGLTIAGSYKGFDVISEI